MSARTNGCDQIIVDLRELRAKIGTNLTYDLDCRIGNLIDSVVGLRDNLVCLLNKGIEGIMDEHDLDYYNPDQYDEDL